MAKTVKAFSRQLVIVAWSEIGYMSS